MNDIAQFKAVIEDIVDAKLAKEGITKYMSAIVSKVYSDGAVDVYLPPDENRKISSVLNKTGETLVVGDSVEICTKNGKLSNAWVSVKHKGNNTGNSSSYREFKIPNTAQSGYVCLGRVVLDAQVETIILNIYEGNGQNGRADQNAIMRAYLKMGYQLSLGATVEYFTYPYGQKLVIIQISSTTYDIYLKSPASYFAGFYTIEGTYSSYQSKGTFSTTEPSGTQKTVTERYVCYRDTIFPIGSVFITVVNTNPQSYLGGTWQAFGQGRTLVGVDTAQTEFNTVLKTGGNKNLQSHTHSFSYSGNTGGGGAHGHQIYLNNDANFPIVGFPGWSGSTVNINRVMMNQGSGTGFYMYANSVGDHTHGFSGSGTTGGAGSGNAQNLQPYITVYFWRRTA